MCSTVKGAERPDGDRGRVVDEHVEPAQRPDGLRGRAAPAAWGRRGRRAVRARYSRRLDRPRRLLQQLPPASGRAPRASLARRAGTRSQPDARPGAGDERDVPFPPAHQSRDALGGGHSRVRAVPCTTGFVSSPIPLADTVTVSPGCRNRGGPANAATGGRPRGKNVARLERDHRRATRWRREAAPAARRPACPGVVRR